MLLFSRRVSMTGSPDEIIGYSTDMAAYVSERVDREVALWSVTMGAPVGTMFYTARVEGVAAQKRRLLGDA